MDAKKRKTEEKKIRTNGAYCVMLNVLYKALEHGSQTVSISSYEMGVILDVSFYAVLWFKGYKDMTQKFAALDAIELLKKEYSVLGDDIKNRNYVRLFNKKAHKNG